jgi:transcriptional regulator with PAS, ATPase and Fis domain
MNWQIRIQDPSGEIRILPILPLLSVDEAVVLGRGDRSTIVLRDPTVGSEAALLCNNPTEEGSPFWLRVPEGADSAHLGDLCVRECCLPPGIPLALGETRITLEREEDADSLPEQPHGLRSWITCSEQGASTLWLTKKASATPLSLYLAGETGTGKEVLAHLAHAWSERASGPFVPLHCAALPLALIESELFGHVKGAFTGAFQHRPGALMQAHGGTLFLDEIGDLPMDIQVKLLRFLENGEIRPVGADRVSHADVRLVCATHKPLLKLVEEGKFRRDLYYRLASVTIEIPSLRSRPDDIELLAKSFAAELKRQLTPRALLRLQAHSWPGNVRELRHAIERACGMAGPFTPVLDEDAFGYLMTQENVERSPDLGVGIPVLSLDEMERVMILKALKIAHGNRAQAAKTLGIARSTLFEMLKRHKIHGPRYRAAEREGGAALEEENEAWQTA